ncbi:MAG: hypothetical protein ABI950_07610 [Solirubrobacteraceae bacterium]
MPRPLLVLLCVAAVEAISWAVLLPPLQGPDEMAHVGYTQRMVEGRVLPWRPAGGLGPERVSTEARIALGWGGVEALRGNPAARPPGSDVVVAEWARRGAGLSRAQRADGTSTTAMANPPLYYVYDAVPYVAASGAGFFDRVMLMRLFNVPLLLATIGLCWLLLGELFPGRPWARTVGVGAVTMQPQVVQQAAVVNPDMLLAAVWSGFLYLAVVTLRRGASTARVGGLVALAAASCLTHARGVSIVAPLGLVLAIAVWRSWRPTWSRGRWAAGAAAVCVAGAPVVYLALRYATGGRLTVSSAREFLSYLWQFYLPALPGMRPPPGPSWGVRDVAVDRLWSGFAQFEVSFPPGVLDAIAWLTLVLALLAVARLFTRWRTVDRGVVAVLFVAVSAYVLQMHLAGFRSVFGGSPDPILTGRYLLPLAGVGAAGLAAAVSWLPRRAAVVAGGVVLALLALVQVGASGLMLERFYA